MSEPVEQQELSKKQHPLILIPLKQRQDESDRSLFKNDSLSSYEAQIHVPGPSKLATHSVLPESDQIRKFLKRGQILNSNTLKRLQDSHQFTKNDRSSASLYKTSRHFEYPLADDEKQAQIRRLYLSHKKPPAKYIFRNPLYKPQRSSIQVQTDQVRNSIAATESQKPIKFHPLHKPSYVSIDVVQEEPIRNHKFMKQISQIEPDVEENNLLPVREKKGVHVRTKALSHHPGNNMNNYIQNMSKLDFTFHSQMGKYSQKYKQYRDQQTVFSKTIDVKPLRPLKQTLSNFNDTYEFKTQPTTTIFDKNQSGVTNNQIIGFSGLKPVTIDNKHAPSRAQTRISRRKPSALQQNDLTAVIKEATNQKDSSLRPQCSNQFNSIQQQSRAREQHQNFSQMVSRIQAENQSIIHQRNRQYPSRNRKMRKNFEVQVPSEQELKVGQGSSAMDIKAIHPIKYAFGASEVDWIHRNYRPRNAFLKEISHSNFQIKKYQNGVYFGQLSPEGLKNGKGVIFYFSGKIYEGQLKNDLKHGVGHEYYPDGSNFKGEFKGGVRHGRGVFQWSNGQVYDGQWNGGRKTGSGMWTSTDGESYIGQWKQDRVQGFGVFVMKNGSRYEGQFKNSLKHGMGTERFQNGQTYVGNYSKNRPNGEGEYYWSNGDYYKGNFSNGLRHGQGYFREGKTNIEYRGEYHNDKKCGFGQIDYGNRLIYGGNFENNFRHGYGELVEDGKLRYRGYWVNDNQVDESNHEPLSSDQMKNRSIAVIEEVQERKQTVSKGPKTIIKFKPKAVSPSRRMPSLSPEGDPQGYKRPCGCNRKH